MKRQLGWMVAALVLLVTWPTAASAQSSDLWPNFSMPWTSKLWTLTIGANVGGLPAFEGIKGDQLNAAPIFSLGPAGGSAERFHGPLDSSGIALFDYEGFSAGPAINSIKSRKADSFSELNGLGDVKSAIELGGFAQYFPTDWFRIRSEVLRGVRGETGVTANFSADFLVPVSPRLTLSGGPRYTLESTAATAPYFSVSQVQSVASGLPVFDAKGGSHSVGAGAQIRYQFDPKWEVHAYLEYDRLLGDAAASPLVTLRGSPNQLSFGLGASYSFDFRLP
ncbi:MAG TPA: MipA/OmpV family protein [Bradyrhizobium sp.]|uniref:MipA/OmpV family protein n=1 Tax=Bradyrhizobium sp. TaxID=376 RepID=UPI002D7FFC60|nr:MipA/OmpV family protein [Bradyrhizobium sp.]HET7887320.1 MipA/OmpV family protein [Bradyrhizobium sp.]